MQVQFLRIGRVGIDRDEDFAERFSLRRLDDPQRTGTFAQQMQIGTVEDFVARGIFRFDDQVVCIGEYGADQFDKRLAGQDPGFRFYRGVDVPGQFLEVALGRATGGLLQGIQSRFRKKIAGCHGDFLHDQGKGETGMVAAGQTVGPVDGGHILFAAAGSEQNIFKAIHRKIPAMGLTIFRPIVYHVSPSLLINFRWVEDRFSPAKPGLNNGPF